MFGIIEVILFFLCIHVPVSSFSDHTELYFANAPKDTDVVEGKSATLHCEVTPNYGISYYWELNGSIIDNSTRRFQQGSNLHFTRVDREKDAGQYGCVAQDPTGLSITSPEATLNIQWIGETSVQLQSPESASYIKSGSEIILRCHLDATGDVHVEWFRNNDRLIKSSSIDIKKRRLHIKSVNFSHNGIYRCTARNEAGVRNSSKNFALAVAGDQTALIQIVPNEQLVKKGGTAMFDCVYNNADGLEWYFKDLGPLESNTRITVFPNGSLQINNAQESDQGMYNCVGIKGESTEVPQSYTAELKIAHINNFTHKSFEPIVPENQPLIFPQGSLFQLTCLEPDSLPLAKKYWLNPLGHTISDNGDIRVDDDGRLIIPKIQTNQAGNYTCVAENIAGKTTKAIEIVVTTKPVILVDPISVTVDENQNSNLTCMYETNQESLPYTILKWRKDGKHIKSDYEDEGNQSNQRVKIYKSNGTLMIQSTKASDRGEYLCEILTVGFDAVQSKPATISVIETLKFSPPPVNKKLELGSNAKIHCKAQGTPPPLIHWEKGAIDSDSFPSHITDMNGTLLFNGVLSEDKGKYTCIASNSQGIINATLNVDVVVAPKFTVLAQNPTEAIEGFSVMLHCVAEGDPKPTIHWDKNLKMNDFNRSRFEVLENGTLYIREVHREDENNYGCTAGSSAGLNRKEIRLVVHTREGYHPGEAESEDSAVTKAVLITMSVAAAYIILVVGLMIWCRYRRRSRKLPNEEGKTETGDVEHTELKEEANGVLPEITEASKEASKYLHKEAQKSDGTETNYSQSSNHSKKSKSSYDKILFSRSNLKDLKLVGRGEFGDIMIAKVSKRSLPSSEKRNSSATTPTDDGEVTVMVKSLVQTKDEAALAEFKREIDIFSKTVHENVVRLWGMCREVEPHYMILEYTDWGDFKQFLIATSKGNSPSLTPVQCVGVIHHLTKGMEHLSAARFVHRDLAARNCLITSNLVAKIALSRLTKEPYSQEYCKHINQIIPLRWLPYEAVYEDEYSAKSDVYAFGVLILEIFSQGELPFPKINDNSFLVKLKEKSLEWKTHKDTPEEIKKLQESCWDINPQDRPSFEHLLKETEKILKSM